VAQRWFPRMDSSSGSVLPDRERFEGTEGLIHKTLMRGGDFFTKSAARLALSVELHRKMDCLPNYRQFHMYSLYDDCVLYLCKLNCVKPSTMRHYKIRCRHLI
jgi:hypothetical protein